MTVARMTDRRMDDIILKAILGTDTDTVTSRYLKRWQLDTGWWMDSEADMANIKPWQFSLCQSLIHQPWHLFHWWTVTSSLMRMSFLLFHALLQNASNLRSPFSALTYIFVWHENYVFCCFFCWETNGKEMYLCWMKKSVSGIGSF